MGVCLISLAALLATALLVQKPAHAGESYTWTGEGNGTSWTDSCNWWPKDSCQQKYPAKEAADDTATIEGLDSGPSAVTLGENITLASLNLGKGPTGASVTGGGLTLDRGLNWTGGTLETKVNLTGSSVGVVSGFDYKELDGEIQNGGRLFIDSGTLNLANASKIDNTGTFSIAKGSRVYGLVCCLTPPTINSTGTLAVGSSLLPGTDTATIDSVSLNVDGTVNVDGGVLEVRWAPGRIDDGTAFTGAGTFRVTNKADMRMNGIFSAGASTKFELDSCSGNCNQASLSGTGRMNGRGQFRWKGGDVDGELTLGQLTTNYVNGPAPKDLDGKITNIGKTVFLSSDPTALPTGPMRFGGGSVFTNSGIFIANERTQMFGIAGCCLPPAASFINTDTGYFSAAGASGTPESNVATVKSMGFRAGGTVHVGSGALDLTDGAATLPAGSRITGSGSVQLTEGQTMAMAGSFSVDPEAELEIGSCKADECTAGRLEGTGTLDGGGRLEWVSGYLGTGHAGATDNLTIAEGSKLALTGASTKQLQSTLTNRGTATFVSPAAPATGSLTFGTNGRFINAATFNLGNRAVLQSGIGCCSDGTARFVNLGKLALPSTLVPSTGSVTVDSLIFENRGTVDLASGTLQLGRIGGYDQLSGSTRLTGGKLASAGQPVKLMGGSLVGKGAIAANVRNLGATVAPGAPNTAGSTGIIKISGNYTHSGADATLKADLKGATPGTGFDQLQVTGEALVNWGVLDIDTGFAPGTTTKLKVLTAGKRLGSGFTRLKDPGLPNDREWYAIYNPLNVTLGVRRA
jgi:fibronectin-binding autotransporter adhesin